MWFTPNVCWMIYATVLLFATFGVTMHIPELPRWFVTFMVLSAIQWVYLWIWTLQDLCPWRGEEDPNYFIPHPD